MSARVSVREVCLPPVSRESVLRYMGAREPSAELLKLLEETVDEAAELCLGRVAYLELPLSLYGEVAELPLLSLVSGDLAKRLKNAHRVLLFAATVGVGIDRLIARYTRLSPAKALCLQALGTERVEALCDTFCEEVERALPAGARLTPRFSPGYGDLPLSAQTELFRVLNCPATLGLTLNLSLLMTPTKSVTAIVGIEEPKNEAE